MQQSKFATSSIHGLQLDLSYMFLNHLVHLKVKETVYNLLGFAVAVVVAVGAVVVTAVVVVADVVVHYIAVLDKARHVQCCEVLLQHLIHSPFSLKPTITLSSYAFLYSQIYPASE